MIKLLKKINWKKGSGEFISFAVIAPVLCFLIIICCSFIKLGQCEHDITNALDAAGRSASVCTNKDDADHQAQLVAESAIMDPSISDIHVTVDYVTGDTEWKAGVIFKVTISAKISTVFYSYSPVFTADDGSKIIEKSMIYTVEGNSYDSSDLFLLADLLEHEAYPNDYQGMLAVGTVIMNRVDSPRYPNTLQEVIYQSGQFEAVWIAPEFQTHLNHPELIPQTAVDCARDLISGSRTGVLMEVRNGHPCTAFYTDLPSLRLSGGISIGGNWFHWHW